MTRDFRTDRIRTTQIIADSAGPVQKANIIIYPSQSATDYAGSFAPGLVTTVGTDAFLFVSGTIASKKIGGSYGIALFGGDVVASGSIVAEKGLSGSLTRLADGSSYLVAGSNVTITSASNGQVVISSTAAGTAAGTAGSVQFNDGSGNFDSDPNFSYDNSLDILTTPKLSVSTQFEVSGTTYIGDAIGNDYLYVNASLKTDIIPDIDRSVSLGSSAKRFANIYTGDLHLRNDRGNWTIVEEENYLCVVNNLTGKKYKMMLDPID